MNHLVICCLGNEGQSDGSGEDDASPTMDTTRGDHGAKQFSDQRAPPDRSGQPLPELEFGSSTLWSNSSRLVIILFFHFSFSLKSIWCLLYICFCFHQLFKYKVTFIWMNIYIYIYEQHFQGSLKKAFFKSFWITNFAWYQTNKPNLCLFMRYLWVLP